MRKAFLAALIIVAMLLFGGLVVAPFPDDWVPGASDLVTPSGGGSPGGAVGTGSAGATGSSSEFQVGIVSPLNNQKFNANEAIDFVGRTLNGTAKTGTWKWEFGADASPATSTEQNPKSVKFKKDGTYTVKLSVTSTESKKAEVSIVLQIGEKPVPPAVDSCKSCSGILQCLACVDKKLVDSLLKKKV